MFVLIVGCSRVGSTVARAMLREGHEVSCLDEDPESHARLEVGLDKGWEDLGGQFTVGAGLETDALVAAVAPYLLPTQHSPAAEHAAAAPDAPAGPRHVHLSVQFGADCLRSGMDPLAFVRYLSSLGDVTSVSRDARPPMGRLSACGGDGRPRAPAAAAR